MAKSISIAFYFASVVTHQRNGPQSWMCGELLTQWGPVTESYVNKLGHL